MHRSRIERFLAVNNTQKTGSLLKSLIAETRYFKQIFTRTKIAIFGTILYNVCCKHRTQSRNVSQYLLSRSVHIYTD